MTIVNDDSRVINKLETSLTDDARVVIYDHRMFIVQATDVIFFHDIPLLNCEIQSLPSKICSLPMLQILLANVVLTSCFMAVTNGELK
jgi:hypothetical protein